MRIIDKNHDFYDYLQDPNDTLVFDRRNSFLLTKEEFLESISVGYARAFHDVIFLLLQCGGTFWLFGIEVIEIDDCKNVKDYNIELFSRWTNYNKPNKLLDLNIITPNIWGVMRETRNRKHKYFKEVLSRVDVLKSMIDQNEFRVVKNLNSHTKFTRIKEGFVKEKQTIPLLKGCILSSLIDPVEIFSAIEEYFSIEKTMSERTSPIGETNNDKIIMHGFDIKTSFRK